MQWSLGGKGGKPCMGQKVSVTIIVEPPLEEQATRHMHGVLGFHVFLCTVVSEESEFGSRIQYVGRGINYNPNLNNPFCPSYFPQDGTLYSAGGASS